MPPPVRHERHGRPHFRLIGWLGLYEAETPGVDGGDNATARLDVINEPQPDALLLIRPECGGQASLSEDDYIEHAPELVAEVSSSRVSIDLNTKLEVYRRNGVREYLVWRILDEAFDWFALHEEEEKFERLTPDEQGIIRSAVFPGLWLDVPALLRGDQRSVLAVARQGCESEEHAAFVRHLEEVRCRQEP